MLSPVVIGGMGGSGTRAFKYVLEEMGVVFGTTDPHQDDLNVKSLVIPWVANTAAATSKEPLRWRGMAAKDALAYLRTISNQNGIGGRWGWKYPLSHLFLPFFRRVFPGCRYIHVIRHGLDMAMAPKEWILHFANVYGVAPVRFRGPRDCPRAEPAHSCLFDIWWAINIRAEKHLNKSWVRMVRYEDLCNEPDRVVGEIAQWIGAHGWPHAAARVQPSPELGRWRRYAWPEEWLVTHKVVERLAHFGYQM